MSLKSLLEGIFDSRAEARCETPDARRAAAVLLMEIARADHDLADAERLTVARCIGEVFGVSDGEARDLLEQAQRDQAHSTSMQPYVAAVNEHCERAEKLRLLESMWHVALADERLDAYEEHMLRRLAELLFLSHSDFIQAKFKVTGHA